MSEILLDTERRHLLGDGDVNELVNLLQNSVEPLPCTSADARCLKLPSHYQTAPERLVDGLDLELRCDHSLGDDVDERCSGVVRRTPSSV